MKAILAALVAFDGTNIQWNASEIVTPLTSALASAGAAAGVIFIIVVGIRYVFSAVRGGVSGQGPFCDEAEVDEYMARQAEFNDGYASSYPGKEFSGGPLVVGFEDDKKDIDVPF